MKHFICLYILYLPFVTIAQNRPDAKTLQQMMNKVVGGGASSGQSIDQMRKNSMANRGAIGDLSKLSGQESIPAKDLKRIAALPRDPLTDAQLVAYINKVNAAVALNISQSGKDLYLKVSAQIKVLYNDDQHWDLVANGLWFCGENEAALLLMGKAAQQSPEDPDILNNFAVFLNQNGGGHLALPLLQYLNKKYPANSTILNNIGQSWFQLGDLNRSSIYLDSAIHFFGSHSQANYTKSVIEESKGNKEAAISLLQKSISQGYSKSKATRLKKMGAKIRSEDINWNLTVPEEGLMFNKFLDKMPGFYYSDDQRSGLMGAWAAFQDALNAKREQLDQQGRTIQEAMQKSLNNPAALVGANEIKTSFSQQKASELFDLAFDRYTDFTLWFMKESNLLIESLSTQAIQLNEDLKTIPASRACARVGKFKEWAYEHNKLRNDFQVKAAVKAKKAIRDLIYYGKYSATSDPMYQSMKIGWEEGFLSMAFGNGEVPFDFDPACMSCGIAVSDCLNYKGNPSDTMNLPDFDPAHCDIQFSLKFGIGKYLMDCNTERINLDASAGPVNVKIDFIKNWVKGTFNGNAEVMVGESIGSKSMGPVKAEAQVGAGVNVEFNNTGVTDVIAIGKGSVEVTGAGEVIGIEGRMGWNSGPTLTGAGILSLVSLK